MPALEGPAPRSVDQPVAEVRYCVVLQQEKVLDEALIANSVPTVVTMTFPFTSSKETSGFERVFRAVV